MKAIDYHCPRCGARPGKACVSERIPSASTLGGGWGGYLECKRPHRERYEAMHIARAMPSPEVRVERIVCRNETTEADDTWTISYGSTKVGTAIIK